MPSPQQILTNLRAAADGAIVVAFSWHVLAWAAILALVAGWKPSRRGAGWLLTAPIASVMIVAFTFHNPFNGALFGALTAALAVIATWLGSADVRSGSPAARLLGGAMVLFGLLYPHFLEHRAIATYLIAAPTGLVPCPTLSLVIGFTLLAGGLGSKAWSRVLAVAGLFYGLFGVIRLGVWLDLGLVAGSVALLVAAQRAGIRDE